MARSIRRDLFNRTEHRTHHVAGRLCFLFESDQECHREGSDPPNMESQKIKLKSHPVWLRLGGSKRCHLPVICLGKTRHNPNIIIILMFGFFVVFYRETKWPKWTQMVNFRWFGGSQDVTGSAVMMSWERKRDVSGAALQTRSIGIAKRKHR